MKEFIMSKKHRQIKNFFLDSNIQYAVAIETIFVILITNVLTVISGFLFFNHFKNEFYYEQIKISASYKINQEILIYLLTISVLLILYAIVGGLFIIVKTHKYVGPKYAAIKFIKEKLLVGQYSEPFALRDGDEFKDLEEAINLLRQDLQSRVK